MKKAASPWYEPEQRRAMWREVLEARAAPGWLLRLLGSPGAPRKRRSDDRGV